MSTVLVTGATSQIGYFLLPRLQAAGHRVTAVSRAAQRMPKQAEEWLNADIGAGDFVCPKAEVLIHLAPLSLMLPLLTQFLAAGGKRVIAFGTTSRFSKAVSPNAKEQSFAAQQADAEARLAALCDQAGAAWTLFRPTLIYGCGRDRNASLIARTISRLGFFPLLGDARGLRQPVHADDLAAACLGALNRPETYSKAYNLSGGETLSYAAMVGRIFDALGRPRRMVRLPLAAFELALRLFSRLPRFHDFNAEMARRMSVDLVFDSAPAARDFGYAPRPFRPEFAGLRRRA